MFENIVPLIGSFLTSGMAEYLFWVFGLAFIATVPCLIRGVWRD